MIKRWFWKWYNLQAPMHLLAVFGLAATLGLGTMLGVAILLEDSEEPAATEASDTVVPITVPIEVVDEA